jgi:hypothetical protein
MTEHCITESESRRSSRTTTTGIGLWEPDTRFNHSPRTPDADGIMFHAWIEMPLCSVDPSGPNAEMV